MNPVVSVVIPTYNRAEKVKNAINSVLAQSFSDLEIIVVDDGSSDGTGEMLHHEFRDRIRYYFHSNSGASMTRNTGIVAARGQWIAFLDSDDVWEKDKLEWQFKALNQFGSECGGCYTDVRFVNHSESRTMLQLTDEGNHHEGVIGANKNTLKALVRPGGAGMVVCLSSFVARADLVKATGGFNQTLLFSEDSEFLFRLALLTKFCYVNLPLIRFDRSPADIRHVGVSSSWDKVEFALRQRQHRLELLMCLKGDIPKEIQNLIREQLGTIHSEWANWYLETGQHQRAREAAGRAAMLARNPNLALKWFLTWTSPRLARRTVRWHQNRKKDAPFV